MLHSCSMHITCMLLIWHACYDNDHMHITHMWHECLCIWHAVMVMATCMLHTCNKSVKVTRVTCMHHEYGHNMDIMMDMARDVKLMLLTWIMHSYVIYESIYSIPCILTALLISSSLILQACSMHVTCAWTVHEKSMENISYPFNIHMQLVLKSRLINNNIRATSW